MEKFFFCVGAQKAGTTFLYKCLKKHDSISLPAIKELHYYDELEAIGNRSFPLNMFAGPYFIRKRFKHLKNAFANKELTKEEKKWIFNYCTLPRNKSSAHKYKRLLNEVRNEKEFVADLTPAYSILDIDTLKLIKKDFPNSIFILILRNPIQRDWSQYKMHMQHKYGNDVSKDLLIEYVTNRVNSEINPRSNYPTIIKNYKSVFGENLKIFFYDNLKKDPLAFVNSILNCLELEGFKHIENKIPNKGVSTKIPEEIRSVLIDKYSSMIEFTGKLLSDEIDRRQVQSWNQ